MDQNKEILKNLLKNIIGSVIGIIILLIFRGFVINLSAMETEIISTYGITIANVLSVVILCLVIVLIYRFTEQSKPLFQRFLSSFEGITELFENIMYIIIIITGYFAFKDIIYPILVEFDLGWLYQLIFVGLVVYPVYIIAQTAINSSEMIVDFFFGDEDIQTGEVAAGKEEDMVVCPYCDSTVPDDKFCVECGREIQKETEGQEA